MSTDPPEQGSEAEANEALVAAAGVTLQQADEPVGVQAETYRKLFDRSLDGILLITPDRIVEGNAAARKMLGMTEAELRAARREDLFVIGPDYAEHAAERERTGRTAGEATFIRKDGTRFPVDFASILPGGIGGHGYGLVTFRDITERKRTEASLRESEERFRRAVTQTKAGYFLIDREGRFAEVNDAWLRIHGFDSAEEVIGRHFSLTQVETDLAASQHIVETMLAGGSVPDGEFSHRRRDGSVGYHTFTLSPVVEQGEVVGLEGFLIDVTERRNAAQALRVISTRLELALRFANAGTWDWDVVNGDIEWSRETFELFGLDPRAAVASFETWRTVLHPEDLAAAERRIEVALAQRTTLDSDYRVVLPNGEVRWINATGEGVYDDNGRPIKMLGICWDITERKRVEEALRESERDLLEAQKLAHIGNYTLDLRTQQLNWSEGMFRIWGLDPKQGAPRDRVGSLIHPEDYERLVRVATDAIERGTPYELELRVSRPDGAERTVIATGEAQCDATGKVVVLKGTHQDITELRRAEEGYRTLFREMLDGFALHEIICDADGAPVDYRFLAINPAFERMTGLNSEDIVGRTVLEVLPGTERYWIETYGDVALNGRPAFFENYHSQLQKHFHVTAFQPLRGQFACIFADITERKRAEEALRESEAKIRGILDNIRVGVTLISPRMEILELNPLMREWFPHIDLEQAPICYSVINRPSRETVCDDCPTIVTLRDGRIHETTRETRVSGSLRKFRVVSSPIFDASGEVSAAIEMVEDVTDRLALELQLQQSQKMESVGRLAGGVAHDFNNMLGVILGHLEMALELTDERQPLHTSLREVQKAAERSAELTRQLLAFARKQTVAPRVVDMNETVAGMLKMLERLIGEDIRLDWQPGEGLWPVRIDPSQIGQILTNLCVNARDAIAGVGRVTIATRNRTVDASYRLAHASLAPGEYVELALSDDGCGMDQETMAKLFEPFFTTKGVGKGTGLGLATVYGIVRQNGGFVEAESELGRGSTLTIYLPRHGAEAEVLESEAETVPPARGHETILLVEDEPALLDLATMMLENQGYVVVAASSPGEAIRLAQEHRGEIHLLITDVVMPEMNGRDLARNLLSLYPAIKRLFMSGYTSDVIAHQGVLEEGVHFLQKPFTSKDLGTRVRAVLDDEE